jgi:hypothetical protein
MFIYYCALCGGWAAFFGWMFGRVTSFVSLPLIIDQGLKGMFVGVFIALALSLVDALWNLSLKQFQQVAMRVGVAVLVGFFGGLLGGIIGQALYGLFGGFVGFVFLIFGWTLTGFLIGASVGIFEMLMALSTNKDIIGASKKEIKAVIGGTAGGFLGGILALMLKVSWDAIFSGKDSNLLWSPWATGFVALGMCIGLLIGLAQIILKEAWIRVEAGFRPGREKILSKERTTIGRAEACDIGLFGDPNVEKLHAAIVQAGNRYFVEDVGTPGGTFLNEQRVVGRLPLRSGDRIRMGRNVLCFQETQKR